MRKNKSKKGFTLVELLIVIAVIAILAAVAFVAIDPATRFSEARNAERWSDVSSILEGVQQYIVDNSGSFPSGVTASTTKLIGTGSGTSCTDATVSASVDLSASLVSTYFATMPTDPSDGTASDTGYYITRDASNHITIGACDPELSEVINVTR